MTNKKKDTLILLIMGVGRFPPPSRCVKVHYSILNGLFWDFKGEKKKDKNKSETSSENVFNVCLEENNMYTQYKVYFFS